MICGTTLAVSPDIKAGGSDGPVSIAQSQDLSVTVQLDREGDYGIADWWAVANTPSGWFSYSPGPLYWIPGFYVAYQGPLLDLAPREIVNISGLPVGTYSVYFGVDMVMNGALDYGQAYYDSVVVEVNEDEDGPDDGSTDEIPRFVNVDYIELSKIKSISKFRSGAGHDYSDDFESCRSMKHYYGWEDGIDPSMIKIFSPVNGTIFQFWEEPLGIQIMIRSEEYPAMEFRIFHVTPAGGINEGDAVVAGQQIATHYSDETLSDIAVGMTTSSGWRFVSYFDVMTDSLFQEYQSRGLNSRSDLIISKEERDADPLACDGEQFVSEGNLENWVTLDKSSP